ncbi:hypothetical protein DJ535_09790 [Citrobacter murliniae]|uniref:Uncharacterized protein n=1 Tax=Citrobacter murliniae TaxID=67829 RepID=A0ABY2PUU0_9ENTR|nr:hypothetical protein DJ535_09790 [Citrobacter murliniae]
MPVVVGQPVYPSSFTPLLRWLHLFTPVTYLSKLPKIPRFAALLRREILWAMPVFRAPRAL